MNPGILISFDGLTPGVDPVNPAVSPVNTATFAPQGDAAGKLTVSIRGRDWGSATLYIGGSSNETGGVPLIRKGTFIFFNL